MSRIRMLPTASYMVPPRACNPGVHARRPLWNSARGRMHPGVSCRLALRVGGVLATVVIAGCPAGSSRMGASGAPPAAQLGEGEDPSRALLSLAAIQPSIERPASVDVKPLSARGEEQLSRATALVAEQRFTEATLELERGLRYDPRHPRLLASLAELHFRAGSNELARSTAQSALEGNADNPRLHLLLGRIAAFSGRWEDSLLPLRMCVLLAADDRDGVFGEGLYELGVALGHAGYLSAAIQQFERLEAWQQEHPASAGEDLARRLATTEGCTPVLRANLLERLGRFEQAAEQLARRIRSGDPAPALRSRRVKLLLQAGRLDAAEQALGEIGNEEAGLLELVTELRDKQGRVAAVVDDLRTRLKASPENSRLATALLEAARNQRRVGDCREELLAFLDRSPGSSDLRLRLLDALIESAQWDTVARVAREGLERDPASAARIVEALRRAASMPGAAEAMLRSTGAIAPADHYVRAEVADAAGQTQRALDELAAEPLDHLPFPPARRLLGRIHLARFEWESAREAARRTQPDVAENPDLEWILGQACEGLDDLAAAELHYKAGLHLDRAHEGCLLSLARVYERTGRDLQYEQQLRAAMEARPENLLVREDLILRYLRTDRIDEAARQLQELDALAPSSSALARCVAAIQRRQQPDPSPLIPALEEAIRRNGPDARTLVLLGDVLSATQQFDAARGRYEEALRLEPGAWDPFMRLVGLDEATLNFEGAVARLEPALARYPNRHPLRSELVQALLVIQKFPEALALASGEAQRPGIEDARRSAYRERIVEILRLMHQDDEARRRLEAWSNEDAPAGPWTKRLILACIEDDRFEDGLRLATKAYEHSDALAEKDLLIDCLIAANRTDRAVQLVLDEIDEDPTNDAMFEGLAAKLTLAERYDEAIALLEQLLDTSTDPDRLKERLFRIRRAAGKHEENVRCLEDWIAELDRTVREEAQRRGVRPDRVEDGLARVIEMLHGWIVQELMMAGRYDAAIARLQQLIDAAPQDESQLPLYMLQYGVYQMAGRTADAQQALETCHRLNPFDAGVNNDLGYLLADQGIRLEEAQRMTRLATAQSPRNPSYLDSYGWVLYKKGDAEGAYSWIRRALHAARREDEVIPDHLGDAAWRTGRREEAQEHWTSALRYAEAKLKDDPADRGAQRVVKEAAEKIEAARSGGAPPVAPLAAQASESQSKP